MNRRELILGGVAAGTLRAQGRKGMPALKITKVEAFIVRTPNDGKASREIVKMSPVGAMTGGVGLWNRLDHMSPTRIAGYQQGVLVKITTDQGLVGWGECHAPSTPRVHQAIVQDLLASESSQNSSLFVSPAGGAQSPEAWFRGRQRSAGPSQRHAPAHLRAAARATPAGRPWAAAAAHPLPPPPPRPAAAAGAAAGDLQWAVGPAGMCQTMLHTPLMH